MIMLAKRDEINYKKTWWENYSKERKVLAYTHKKKRRSKVYEFFIRRQNI